jgi:hypothetical protein
MFSKDLKEGSWGLYVFYLQRALQYLRYDSFVPTGVFGKKTKAAVIKFQHDHQLPETGFFGPQTRAAMNQVMSNRMKLYFTALQYLGTDVTPNDVIPDEYACADTVCTLLKKAGVAGDVPYTPSTNLLYSYLERSKYFTRVDQPLPGDICLSPTGYGNGTRKNGHVGIVAENDYIMSNDSSSGRFERNYTLGWWKEVFAVKGGYPMLFYRRI